MSSIRLFILGSFAQHGELHGHQLRLLAEEEHVHLWTDVTVGAIYGALKRLVAEGLLAEVRTEREGNYPERQVYAISDEGREALTALRFDGLRHIGLKPDPFDLALTRLDPDKLDELPTMLDTRLDALNSLLHAAIDNKNTALPYLTISERHAFSHREHRVRSEIAWLEGVIASLPEIIADERSHNGGGYSTSLGKTPPA